MTTLKLLRLQTTLSHDEIFNYLNGASYDERSNEGFVLESNYNNQIAGTFYNTITLSEKIIDPLGNEINTYVVIVEKTEFIIDSKKGLLMLINPFRNIKHFYTVLGVALEHNVSLVELKLNLLKFVQVMQFNRKDIVLSSIDITGISLSPLSMGKVSISGNEDVLKYVSQFQGNRDDTKIKKIRLCLDSDGKQSKIDFLDSFIIRASSISKDKLLYIFKNDLEDFLFQEIDLN